MITKKRNKTVFADYLKTIKNDLSQNGSTVTIIQRGHFFFKFSLIKIKFDKACMRDG